VPVVIGGLILSFLVMLLFGGTEIDRALLILFSGPEPLWLAQAARLLALAAGPTPLLLLVMAGAGLLLFRRDWRGAVLLLGIALLGRLLVDGLQGASAALRPSVEDGLAPAGHSAYPSGHAAHATIAGFALAYILTRHYPARALALGVAASLALLAGAARVIEGAAWPSDVIGGWALGLAWVLLVLLAARHDLGDGTARALRHSCPQGEHDGKPQDRDRPPD
jgi:undecaprenyl-diphosphatase